MRFERTAARCGSGAGDLDRRAEVAVVVDDHTLSIEFSRVLGGWTAHAGESMVYGPNVQYGRAIRIG